MLFLATLLKPLNLWICCTKDLPAGPPGTRPQEQHLGSIIPCSQGRFTFGHSLGTLSMVTIIKCINIYFYERTSNCQVYTHNKLFERSGGKWRLQYSGELSKQISPCRKGQVSMAQLCLSLSPRTCAIIYPPHFFCSCVENSSALIGKHWSKQYDTSVMMLIKYRNLPWYYCHRLVWFHLLWSSNSIRNYCAEGPSTPSDQ